MPTYTTRVQHWTPRGMQPLAELLEELEWRRQAAERIVTTNGCFDLLHPGHVRFLNAARALGDVLVVGLNSDESVRQLKGAGRPILPEAARAEMLAALASVDHVVVFDDLLPNHFLGLIKPSIHCKAGDYDASTLPEAPVVTANGGQVVVLPIVEGFSTSDMIARVTQSVETVDTLSVRVAESENASEQVIAEFLEYSNLLRQSGYRMHDRVVAIANRVALLARGNRLWICRDNSSAIAAQLGAAEFAARLSTGERDALAAVLIGDSTRLVRQIQELTRAGDILFALSSEALSPNLLAAAQAARQRGLFVVGITGDVPLLERVNLDVHLGVPSVNPARIQQVQIALLQVIGGVAVAQRRRFQDADE